ncbi:MAG: hypothetical protein SFU86_09485 [Pirellulaceae bacterium]|nr:hypothetical protein [Pirellulaceae bacterium]
MLAFTLLCAACGGPKVVPVKGQVKFADGSDPAALAGYVVTFQPGDGAIGGFGTVGADGSFTISTFGENDGAVPGTHQVALTPPGQTGEGPRPKPIIGRHYGNPSDSGLAVEVRPDAEAITLTVERLK